MWESCWFQSLLQIVKISWNDFNLHFIAGFFYSQLFQKNHFFIKNKLWQKLRNQENKKMNKQNAIGLTGGEPYFFLSLNIQDTLILTLLRKQRDRCSTK